MSGLARRAAGAFPVIVLLVALAFLATLLAWEALTPVHAVGWGTPTPSPPPCASAASTPLGECWT